MDSNIEKVINEYNTLESNKSYLVNLWQEIGEFCYPAMSNFTRYYSQTSALNRRITYDQTAEHSLDLFASSMMSYLCNPATKWIGYALEDKELEKSEEGQKFLDEAQNMALSVFNNPRTKFYDNIFTALKITGAFGTSPFITEEDKYTVAKFKAESPQGYCFNEDFAGNIKDHYFMREMTVDILTEKAEKDGWEIPQEILNRPKSEKVKILRKIYLNDDYDPQKAGIKFAKYKSCYYLYDKKALIKDAFFNEAPLGVARWDRINNDVWSDAPARVALSDIKMINATQKTAIISIERTARPSYVVSSESKMSKIDLSPDAFNVARGSIRDAVAPLNTGGNPQLLIDWQELIRKSIRTAFYIDIFQTAEQVDITAFEANIRQQEKLKNIGPKVAKLLADLIGPTAERVLYLLIKQGKLKVPKSLVGKEIKIIYVSPISSAYRSQEANSILQYLNDVTVLSNLETQLTGQSSIADKIDFDELAEELAEIRGVRAKAIKPEKETKDLREAKVKAAQAQNALNTASQASEIAKNIPQPMIK